MRTRRLACEALPSEQDQLGNEFQIEPAIKELELVLAGLACLGRRLFRCRSLEQLGRQRSYHRRWFHHRSTRRRRFRLRMNRNQRWFRQRMWCILEAMLEQRRCSYHCCTMRHGTSMATIPCHIRCSGTTTTRSKVISSFHSSPVANSRQPVDSIPIRTNSTTQPTMCKRNM